MNHFLKNSCLWQSLYLFCSAIKLGLQMMRGACTLGKVRMPIITVFGGREAKEDSMYYTQAYEFAKRCAQNRISVITGGGPGIMYAANCGAHDGKSADEKKLQTIGIAVKGIDEAFDNKCAPLIWVNYFFIRKWLLVRYSIGIVVFPGGIGTMDELFEVLNVMKHQRVPAIPVILIGTDYWQPILTWMQDKALKHGYIKEAYLHLFIVTDSIDEAFGHIKKVCSQYGHE